MAHNFYLYWKYTSSRIYLCVVSFRSRIIQRICFWLCWGTRRDYVYHRMPLDSYYSSLNIWDSIFKS